MNTLPSNTLEPNPDDMVEHLLLLFTSATDIWPDAQFEIRCIHPHGKPILHRVFPCREHGYAQATNFAIQANGDGYNIYVTVNPVQSALSGSARDENVIGALFQFIDVDGVVDPEALLDQHCTEFAPAFRVISGSVPLPRMHVYWRMACPVASMADWRTTQKNLATVFGSDTTVCNPSRVLRLAGSVSNPDGRKSAKGYIPEIVRLQIENGSSADPGRFAAAFHCSPEAMVDKPVISDAAWPVADIGGDVPVAVIEAALNVIPPVSAHGSRNQWLQIAYAVKAANPAGRLAFEAWQRQSPLFSTQDDRLWDTLSPDAGSYAGLFARAKVANPDWWRHVPAVADWWRERAASQQPRTPGKRLRAAADIIANLATRQGAGEDITPEMCVCDLPTDSANVRKVRDYAIRALKISSGDFDAAMHRKKIVEVLGSYPKTAFQFVKFFVERERIECQYNGVLYRNGAPTDDIGFHEIQRDMRVLADELKLAKFGIGHPQINDATEKWYAEAQRARKQSIAVTVKWHGGPQKQAETHSALIRLVESCFEYEAGAEYTAAVLLKFIHQVKRKMLGLPVSDHLMPVLITPRQGVGKSEFVKNLLSPIAEAAVTSDFKQITDDRNITLWKSFVLYFDEMSWASKADIETVKHIITARTLSRRPMRTNHVEEIRQNATLIGTANVMAISDIIRDPTGMRRFAGIMMKDQPDWNAVNTMDWGALWQSVNPEGEDPMAPFKQLLAERQAADREKAPVEVWQEQIDPTTFLCGAIQVRRSFGHHELFEDFHRYEQEHFPRYDTTVTKFTRELGRIAKQCPDTAKFVDERGAGGRSWKWVGELPHNVRRMFR